MDKIREVDPYTNTIKQNSDFFKSYYFHSLIDLNLIKLDSILKNGILSKSQIEQRQLIDLYTHDAADFDSKNGNDYISLTEYRNDCHFNILFESFPHHTMTSISVLTDKSLNTSKYGERESFFDDEIFCPHGITKDHLQGILLPEYLTNLEINKTNCLPNDLSCYTKKYINHLLYCIEKYFNRPLPKNQLRRLKNSYEILWKILQEFERPEIWLQKAINIQRQTYGEDIKDIIADILQQMWSEKLNISKPNNLDIITYINSDNLPIYEIKRMSLKKLN